MCVMSFFFIGNLLIQMTPCYAEERFDCARITFYVLMLMVCLGLAFAGRFVYATDLEVQEFYGQLECSFLYLGIGFLFYMTKFPESHFKSEFVQLYLNSHMWWHVFTFANGYTLYWLCFQFNMYIEKYWGEVAPGAPEDALTSPGLF